MRYAAIMLALVSAVATGCASKSGDRNAGEELEVRAGLIEEIRQVPLPGSSGGYIGTVGGGAAGGIAGSTVGSGRGSQTAAVAGAVAGSVAGRALESSLTSKEGLEISVRLDSGRLMLVLQPAGETFKPGERVRVISGSTGTRVTH
jgi:outer membrane lipoprotein SlyB